MQHGGQVVQWMHLRVSDFDFRFLEPFFGAAAIPTYYNIHP